MLIFRDHNYASWVLYIEEVKGGGVKLMHHFD